MSSSTESVTHRLIAKISESITRMTPQTTPSISQTSQPNTTGEVTETIRQVTATITKTPQTIAQTTQTIAQITETIAKTTQKISEATQTFTQSIAYNTTSFNDTVSEKSPPYLSEEKRNLIWILPAVFGILIFLGGVACLLFFFLRKTELFCIRMYGVCCRRENVKMRRSYKELDEELAEGERESQRPTSYYLKDLEKRDPFSNDPYQ